MAKIYELRGKPVIDWQNAYETITAGAGSVTSVFKFKTKTGAKPLLVKFGNAAGAGGEAYLSFTLYINGIPEPRFLNVDNMITDPSNPESQLPFELELQQGAEVEVKVTNSDGANDYAATASVIIYYVDPR